MNSKQITWNVTSLKGADPFDVLAPCLEDAVCDALVKLGWTISPGIVKPDTDSEIHVDANQSLADDFPAKDEFITSSALLDLAKNHSLELSLSLNGFLTKRFLSLEREGVYSHKFGNGAVHEISAEDFLRIYPDAHGKVWRVDRVISKEPVSRRSLVLKIKNFFANCFYLATYSWIFYLG